MTRRIWQIAVASCVIGLAAGCSGPFWQFPGGALSGEESAFDLNRLSPDGGVIQLETNPQAPYSVNVGYVVINGNMYVDPTPSRTWCQNMKDNPLIRLRFESSDAVHPAIAIEETDPQVLAQFENDRYVLRLEPRSTQR